MRELSTFVRRQVINDPINETVPSHLLQRPVYGPILLGLRDPTGVTSCFRWDRGRLDLEVSVLSPIDRRSVHSSSWGCGAVTLRRHQTRGRA